MTLLKKLRTGIKNTVLAGGLAAVLMVSGMKRVKAA